VKLRVLHDEKFHNLYNSPSQIMNRDSSVGIVTDYRLDDRMIGVRFPAGARNFSPLNHVQKGSGPHPFSYPIVTGGSFLGGKATGT
jgi:hypothetical protein